MLDAALASSRIPNLLAHTSSAVIKGFWLGVLSEAGLRGLDERYYDRTELYQTAGWNERGLFGWEREAIDKHFAGRERVAVVGSGGGREVLALLRAGYDAIGFESHPELAARADAFLTERGHPDRAHPARRDEFPAPPLPCDAAVIGWGAYSLVHPRARRVSLLADAVRQLPPGAPVLLSFFTRSHDTRELRLTRSIAGALRRLRGGPPIELGDTLSPSRVHVFSREELGAELAAAGMELSDFRTVDRVDDHLSYAAAVARVS